MKLTFGMISLLAMSVAAYPINAKPRPIRGSVSDEAGNAIPAAIVELSCVRDGKSSVLEHAKSDTNGHFQLEATPDGRCQLKISAPGFAKTSVRLSTSGNHGTTDVGKIQLRVSCSGPGVICDEVTPKKE
jgi:Carboxypeptidase regulatory-like domain